MRQATPRPPFPRCAPHVTTGALGFYHFHVHRQKQCLLLMLDDYSRFITGFTLLRSEHVAGLIRAFEESVTRYDRLDLVPDRPLPRLLQRIAAV